MSFKSVTLREQDVNYEEIDGVRDSRMMIEDELVLW